MQIIKTNSIGGTRPAKVQIKVGMKIADSTNQSVEVIEIKNGKLKLMILNEPLRGMIIEKSTKAFRCRFTREIL